MEFKLHYFKNPKLFTVIVGFFYFCQFIKSFRPFHSFWEEEDLSWEINTSFTEWHIIISWVFSLRVIQPTVRWHTFKTFYVCFHQFLFIIKTFRDSWLLTGGNWQKWKRVFLTCPCHKIYRDEAVGLKSCKYTWKITKFVKMGNLGQYRENLIFCQ